MMTCPLRNCISKESSRQTISVTRQPQRRRVSERVSEININLQSWPQEQVCHPDGVPGRDRKRNPSHHERSSRQDARTPLLKEVRRPCSLCQEGS